MKNFNKEIDLNNLKSTYFNGDCIEGMKHFSDNYFDLAIVDPPYGNADKKDPKKYIKKERFVRKSKKGITNLFRYDYYFTDGTNTKWDIAPPKEYFDELFRVSKNQVIFGGNFFELPPTNCFIVWDKLIIPEEFNNMSMCEYAWTSFQNKKSKIFRKVSNGNINNKRIHPSEKPIELYDFILNYFSEKGDVILDTHVGSGNSLIACNRTNHKYIGFEIDPIMYEKSKEHIEEKSKQITIYNYFENEREEQLKIYE